MPVAFTYLRPRLVIGALVWLGAVAFLVHYCKGFRKNLADLRQSREDYVAARWQRGEAPDALRRDLLGEIVAFGGLLLLAVLAASIALGGLVWFLTCVIGGLHGLLR